jgi:hypothetical protein
MYFARKMKLNIRVIGTLGIQEPFTLRQVYQVTIFIGGNIVGFEPGKIFQFPVIGTGDPAGFVVRHGPELARGAILLQ